METLANSGLIYWGPDIFHSYEENNLNWIVVIQVELLGGNRYEL